MSFLHSLENIFTCKQLNQNKKNIIMGDININLLESSKQIETYQSFVNSFNYYFLSTEPTRITNTSVSCIDHFITQSHLLNDIKFNLLDFQLTDHKCFKVSIAYNQNKKLPVSFKRDYSTKNIIYFSNEVGKQNWHELMSISESIDSNINSFMKSIIKCHNLCFPLIPLKNKSTLAPWINKDIKEIIKKKRISLKRFHKNNNSVTLEKLRSISKQLKTAIHTSKNKYYSTSFSTGNSKEKWDKINKFAQIKHKVSFKNNSLLNTEDFANHFSTILSTKNNNYNPPLLSAHSCPQTFYAFRASEDEIIPIIQTLKNKNCHQPYDIPLFLWRSIATNIANPITFLANQMFSTAIFPKICKLSILTPIFKKGNIDKPENYRPIAGLHNLSKIFERLMLNRITNFASINNLLPDCQYGFRPKYSTKDAVLSLLFKIEQNLCKNLKTCCIFLDLSKAFDKVNHALLLNTLEKLGFRGLFGSLLENYLADRSYRVKHDSKFSLEHPILQGVPQGSIISPILYSLYVSDMIDIEKNLIQYADDTTIILSYSNLNELQNKINTIENRLNTYIKNKNLSLNTGKTEIMIFGDKSILSLNFMQSEIKIVNQTKFLGIYIDSQRNFNKHIHLSILPNIRKMFKYFYFLSSVTNKTTKKTLFDSFILPHIHYAIPFILFCDITQFTFLNRTYNKALKILFALPHRFHSIDLPLVTNIPSLSSIIKKHSAIIAHTLFHSPIPAHTSFFIRTQRCNFILDPHRDKRSVHNHLSEVWNSLTYQQKTIKSKKKFRLTLT